MATYEDQIKALADAQKKQALANLDQSKQTSLSQLDQYRQSKLNDYLNSENTGIGQLDQYKNNQMTSLTNNKNQDLSALDQQQSQIEPMYYDKRNATSTQNQLQAKNFAEYMANRGMANSGTNAQAQLSNNIALQNNIGNLNKQENADNQAINTKKTTVNTNFDNSVQGLTSDYNLKLKVLQDAYNANAQALQNEVLGKTNDINSQYQNNLNTQYANIDTNYANQLSAYQKEQEQLASQRAYEQQQTELAYQRQLALQQQAQQAALQKAQAANQTAKAQTPKQQAAQQTQVFQSAVSSLQKAMQNGQGAAWVQANRDAMSQALSPQEQASLSPGGYIYHQLLKGD
jgi:hypothetical protein